MIDINMQKCPNCAGILQTDLQKMVKECPFCGAIFYIDGNGDAFTSSTAPVNILSEDSEEKNSFDIRLVNFGSNKNKVKAIKVYRELSGYGLKEAKDIIDSAPCLLFEGLDKNTAEAYAVQMRKEAVGIDVEVV